VAKTAVAVEGVVAASGGARAEAHSALTTLGITAKQAENILNKLLKSNPNATTEELVRQALQML